MLKKFRIKFIVVIMLVVTLMFAVIFTGILHFTRRNMERESLQMIRAMSFQPINMNIPAGFPNADVNTRNKMRLPFFTLTIGNDGEITALGGSDFFDLDNEDLLEELVSAAEEQEEHGGRIWAESDDGNNTFYVLLNLKK